MIVPNTHWAIEDCDMEEVQPPQLTLFQPAHHRVSELLGPDGEPLIVPYERPSLGFDLRPRPHRTKRGE